MIATDTLDIFQENTKTFTMTVELGGVAFDLTGYTCNFIARQSLTSAKVIDFNLGAGDIATNVLTVNLTTAHTDLDVGSYIWEMRVNKAGGRTEVIGQGVLNIKDSII